MSRPYAAEMAFDQDGNLLWTEQWIFRRVHGPGEQFVRDSRTYEVIKSEHWTAPSGNILVEHAVREKP